MNTKFPSKNVDHSFAVQSPGRMSPRKVEPISPMSSRISMLAQCEKMQQFRSLSSRELGSSAAAALAGSSVNSWSKWGSPNGKLDWAVSSDDLGKFHRSSSFELGNNGEEPDLSWVQTLVKESPAEFKEPSTSVPGMAVAGTSGGESNMGAQIELGDHALLGAWLEQMQLDHLVAQQN